MNGRSKKIIKKARRICGVITLVFLIVSIVLLVFKVRFMVDLTVSNINPVTSENGVEIVKGTFSNLAAAIIGEAGMLFFIVKGIISTVVGIVLIWLIFLIIYLVQKHKIKKLEEAAKAELQKDIVE